MSAGLTATWRRRMNMPRRVFGPWTGKCCQTPFLFLRPPTGGVLWFKHPQRRDTQRRTNATHGKEVGGWFGGWQTVHLAHNKSFERTNTQHLTRLWLTVWQTRASTRIIIKYGECGAAAVHLCNYRVRVGFGFKSTTSFSECQLKRARNAVVYLDDSGWSRSVLVAPAVPAVSISLPQFVMIRMRSARLLWLRVFYLHASFKCSKTSWNIERLSIGLTREAAQIQTAQRSERICIYTMFV